MRRFVVVVAILIAVGTPLTAQQEITVIDSIAVSGNERNTRGTILATVGIPIGEPISFRDVQRGIDALYNTRQYSDIQVYQGTIDGQEVLEFVVTELPILDNWSVRGPEEVPERRVRGRIRLIPGLPYDHVAATRSRASIDSLYEDEGYYQTDVVVREIELDDGSIQVVFDVREGRRITISRVIIEGNEEFRDEDIVAVMKTSPEGFWWFQQGDLDETELDRDIRQRIPDFYAKHGFIDFHVVDDSLDVNFETGKAALIVTVEEGEKYRVGTFEIVGNRVFATEALQSVYPFGRSEGGFLGLGGSDPNQQPVFDRSSWDEATGSVQTMYMNNGYIYAQVNAPATRRTTEDGRRVVDLRWQIVESQPAIVNKIEIRGNTVTHEDVIRRQIVMVPGDVMRQSALIRSYQNIQNLGFFEQPLPVPRTEPANQQGDVNIIFEVVERHTGNINFGATVGQGTGIGGFIGLSEPNLFGRGKRGSIQWQFGANINDITVSYTDPSIRGSLISGMIAAHSSRLRYTIADLGRIQSRGVTLQAGFPLLGSRFTRLLTTYTFEQSKWDSPTLQSAFRCDNCIYSAISATIVRDTRIDLPFPSAGLLHRFTVAQAGGPLGGSGNFRKAVFEGRWYSTLKNMGGEDALSSRMKLILGLGAQAGFIWGDPGPHFRQLFSMGGTQFGIPLRGYDEFSVTPNGFDPSASGSNASSVDAFARSYFWASGEIGLRLSQSIYTNIFMDAGNVWSRSGQFNPTRLFRGAGIGLAMITPLGPIGLDYAYGFDRVDLSGRAAPKWKFHFRLGNFF